jgi:hypothetical protein
MFKFTDKVVHILLIVGTVLLTALVMNFIVVKPMNKLHNLEMARQIKQNDKVMGLFLELAKQERFKIENTFTIKKPKKGSTVDIVIDNKMDAQFQQQANNLDDIIKKAAEQDTIPVVKKTFWQRIF